MLCNCSSICKSPLLLPGIYLIQMYFICMKIDVILKQKPGFQAPELSPTCWICFTSDTWCVVFHWRLLEVRTTIGWSQFSRHDKQRGWRSIMFLHLVSLPRLLGWRQQGQWPSCWWGHLMTSGSSTLMDTDSSGSFKCLSYLLSYICDILYLA